MKKITFYIGSDNTTHLLDKESILKLATDYFGAFTFVQGEGYWNGKQEETAILTIIGDSHKWLDGEVEAFVSEACFWLHQECILVEESEVKTRFLSRERSGS